MEKVEEPELIMVITISFIQTKEEDSVDALEFSLGRWVLKE